MASELLLLLAVQFHHDHLHLSALLLRRLRSVGPRAEHLWFRSDFAFRPSFALAIDHHLLASLTTCPSHRPKPRERQSNRAAIS